MKYRNLVMIWCLIGGAAVIQLFFATAAPGDNSLRPSDENLLIQRLMADIPGAKPKGENAPAPDVNQVALAINRTIEDLRLSDTHLAKVRRYQDVMKKSLASILSDQSRNSTLISHHGKAAKSTQSELKAIESLFSSISRRLVETTALSSLHGSSIAADLKQISQVLDRTLPTIRSAMEKNLKIARLAAESPDKFQAAVQGGMALEIDMMMTTLLRSISQAMDIDGPWGNWRKTFDHSDLREINTLILAYYTCDGHWATKCGTSGDDIIEGTNGPDVIVGRGGNDTIQGDDDGFGSHGGDDIICGNAGDDHIHGAGGSDIIYGGLGDDLILGEYDGNYLYGGDGNDNLQVARVIYGGNGNDGLFAGESEESHILVGEDGDDGIHGGPGMDVISGGEGSDWLSGQGGNDTISAGPSNGNAIASFGSFPQIIFVADGSVCGDADWDFIWGGDGDDIIFGEGGHDYIWAGAGADVVYGGYFTTDDDTAPDDRDCVWGEDGIDTIYGKGGDDYIDGGDREDTLNGDAGNDLVTGMNHDDKVYGGTGNDRLYGDGWCSDASTPGADQLVGGSGDDLLSGGGLNDNCDGETGTDSSDGTCETETSIP